MLKPSWAAATGTPGSTPDVEPVPSVQAPAFEYSASPAVTVGLYALCTYLVSGYATDLSYRFLGSKPYVSMISGIIVFLCFLMSGRTFVALKSTVGRLWLGLAIWMCVCVIFSRWRSGSIELLQTYLTKQHLILFCMAAFAPTVKHCRSIMRASIFGTYILILVCIFFGQTDTSGRFAIPTNIYFMNPNDLAIQLLLGLGFFLFNVRQQSWMARIIGAVGFLGASYFLLKTASRGALIACVVFVMLWIFVSENRARLVVLALPIAFLLIVLMPRDTLHRLTLLGSDVSKATTSEEEKALSSQWERQHLLKESIKYAIRNPLFGIGPGRFGEAIWEDAKSEGRHEASLGTHNTYTQIAAECGIPGLIMYVAAIVITIRSSFRLCRATMRDKSQQLVSALAFTCCVMTTAFAISVFFHHMAYYRDTTVVLGLWVATDLATRNRLNAAKAAPVAA